MYRLAGDWMAGTEPVAPTRPLAAGPLELGGHRLELIALEGHTGADLAILDRSTGVLFAGDLIFHDRAPTTPHARLPAWQASLDTLEALPFRHLVPGHGPVATDAGPIRQTRAWLGWLDHTLRKAADEGLDMTEALALPLPYLTPHPHRGERNRPALVRYVGAAVAEARGVPVAEVAAATWDNATSAYRLPT